MTYALFRGTRGRIDARATCGLVLLAVLTGCTESVPVCNPVRGQVTLDGKPLAEAMVVLHPLDGTVKGPRPVGHTDQDGRFTLTTIRTGDGAFAGEYAVTVEYRAPRTSGEEVVRDGPNLLPSRYGIPEDSGIRAHVSDGENELPEIKVSRK